MKAIPENAKASNIAMLSLVLTNDLGKWTIQNQENIIVPERNAANEAVFGIRRPRPPQIRATPAKYVQKTGFPGNHSGIREDTNSTKMKCCEPVINKKEDKQILPVKIKPKSELKKAKLLDLTCFLRLGCTAAMINKPPINTIAFPPEVHEEAKSESDTIIGKCLRKAHAKITVAATNAILRACILVNIIIPAVKKKDPLK